MHEWTQVYLIPYFISYLGHILTRGPPCFSLSTFSSQLYCGQTLICTQIGFPFRISIRAFTQLFDEDLKEFTKPLYSDTFFSLPITTESGKANLFIYPHRLPTAVSLIRVPKSGDLANRGTCAFTWNLISMWSCMMWIREIAHTSKGEWTECALILKRK